MPDAIWIDDQTALGDLARALEPQTWIGVDTEFLRERTFFPKLCLLQLSAGSGIWCVDTLWGGSLDPLIASLTAPTIRKILHSARQDLEAMYLTTKRVMSPIFDTQIAAACIGLKPQIGYADLVKTLLDVTLAKGQTRTDWSKRPLTPEQLDYAADDVRYLGELAEILTERLRKLGREQWVTEDCLALEEPSVYEPDPAMAWERLRGISALPPSARSRAKAIAIWREKLARKRNLPRAWILPDPALFEVAHENPATVAAVSALASVPPSFNAGFAAALLEALQESLSDDDTEPARDGRPTLEQKTVIDRLAGIVDARAAELQLSPEILAPRGELKALGMGQRQRSHALEGWRRAEIGERLLAALP